MAKRSPAFQFYPKDWRDVRVRRMSNAAKGVYMDILSDMWADSPDQCSILNDDLALAKSYGYLKDGDYPTTSGQPVVQPLVDAWLTIKAQIQWPGDPIFEEIDGRLVSKRLREEAEKQRKYLEKVEKASAAGVKARRSTSGRPVVQPMVDHGSTSSSSSSSSVSSPVSSLSESLSSDLDSYSLNAWIVARWNEIPGVKIASQPLPPAIAKKLAAKIRQHPKQAWWIDYFERIQRSDFLCGRVREWSATFDWILGPQNMAKVLLGNYDNKPAEKPVSQLKTCAWRPSLHIGPGRPKPCGQPIVPFQGKPYCKDHLRRIEAAEEIDRATIGGES